PRPPPVVSGPARIARSHAVSWLEHRTRHPRSVAVAGVARVLPCCPHPATAAAARVPRPPRVQPLLRDYARPTRRARASRKTRPCRPSRGLARVRRPRPPDAYRPIRVPRAHSRGGAGARHRGSPRSRARHGTRAAPPSPPRERDDAGVGATAPPAPARRAPRLGSLTERGTGGFGGRGMASARREEIGRAHV